jgi:hypothetical protein
VFFDAKMNSSTASYGRIGLFGDQGHVVNIPLSVIVKVTYNTTTNIWGLECTLWSGHKSGSDLLLYCQWGKAGVFFDMTMNSFTSSYGTIGLFEDQVRVLNTPLSGIVKVSHNTTTNVWGLRNWGLLLSFFVSCYLLC